MNKIIKNLIWLVFVGLIIGNVYIFVSGIKTSDEINRLDKETTRLHGENIDLDKKINQISSFTYTASMAADLNYTEKPAPIVIEGQRYAFKN